jgi:hypothetical protein
VLSAGRWPIQIEIGHAGVSKHAVVLRQEGLDGNVGDELLQIDVPADALAPHGIDRFVDLVEQIADGGVEDRVGVQLVSPGLEDDPVRRGIVAEILALERFHEVALEQISRLVAECPLEKGPSTGSTIA